MTAQDQTRSLPLGTSELIVILELHEARALAAAVPGGPRTSQELRAPAPPEAMAAVAAGRTLAERGLTLTPLFPGAFAFAAMTGAGDGRGGEGAPSPADGLMVTDGDTGSDEMTAIPLPAAQPLETFFRVEAPEGDLEELAEQLRDSAGVAGAYVRPAIETPSTQTGTPTDLSIVTAPLNTMDARPTAPAETTPDFTSRQGYLDASPTGIDARYAWTIAGGTGSGLRIIDCEHGWLLTHEDLTANNGGVVSGTNNPSNDHGTAVFGEIGGDRNGRGVTGIVPDAWLAGASWTAQSAATAINDAAARLRPGDLLLLEGQLPGPRRTDPNSDVGLIALEWWPDLFAAIRAAADRGIIVVEAAGNGFQNLDDAVYNTPLTGFPRNWRNPFNLANRQSGAIMVGAGAPPEGFNGSVWGTDRSRLAFSNHGRRVDAQGWGREVTTTGYGNLQGGTDATRWYTDTFSGTSSAAPIVLGAIAAAQGTTQGRGPLRMTPRRAIDLLRATGAPQQSAAGRPASQRIGNRPDARALIAAARRIAVRSGDLDGDGRAELVVTSPWGIGILERSGGSLLNPVIKPNGTRLGGWLLNTADNLIGPVADFDGDGRAEILVTSPWGIGILERSGGTLDNPTIAPNGTRFGDWLLNTNDDRIVGVGDLDGDRKAEIVLSSPWGLGILEQSGTTFTNPVSAQNGTRFGDWLLNTADNHVAAIADLDGDGRAEILVTSPWGIGILQRGGSGLTSIAMAGNGTRIGGWLLNTADNRIVAVADLDGDGRAEIVITSPWGIGILKLGPSGLTNPVIAKNGTRLGEWLLDTADNQIVGTGDLDGDGRAEIVVSSPWGLGVLELSGGTLANPVIQPNGTRFGGWLLNTAESRPGAIADYDGDGRAEILVTSPWGIELLERAGGTFAGTVAAPNGTRFGGWLLNTADNEFGV